MKFSGMIVNNTGTAVLDFNKEIREAIGATGALPPELADLFSLTMIEGKAILNELEDVPEAPQFGSCDRCARLFTDAELTAREDFRTGELSHHCATCLPIVEEIEREEHEADLREDQERDEWERRNFDPERDFGTAGNW